MVRSKLEDCVRSPGRFLRGKNWVRSRSPHLLKVADLICQSTTRFAINLESMGQIAHVFFTCLITSKCRRPHRLTRASSVLRTLPEIAVTSCLFRFFTQDSVGAFDPLPDSAISLSSSSDLNRSLCQMNPSLTARSVFCCSAKIRLNLYFDPFPDSAISCFFVRSKPSVLRK